MKNTGTRFIKQWKSSIGTRFVLLVAGILSLTMGIAAVVTYQSQHAHFLEQLATRGETLGRFISSVSAEAILSYDFVTLNEYTRTVSQQPDIVYAVILSTDNENLTSYIDRQNPYVAGIIERSGKKKLLELVETLGNDPHVIPLVYSIDFNGRKLGSIALGMDRTGVDALSRQELARELAGITFIILFLSACIYVVFRHNTLQPIQQLIRGSERVANGDLDRKVPIFHNDELGSLAASFNEMMDNLKRSTCEKGNALKQLEELNRTLESRVVGRTRELQAANKELEILALHDPLTGLPNRTLIIDRLHQGIAAVNREHQPIAIIMLDLDRFKEINDTLGHDVGDELLKAVGGRLASALRETDTVGRLGGDEFAIILPGADLQKTLLIASKIQKTLEPPFFLEDMSFSLGASFGIALYPKHARDTSGMLKCADIAMYVAKRKECGVFVYDAAVDRHSTNQLTLMTEVRTAIEDNVMELYYQPMIDLSDGSVFALEALVRWPHRDRRQLMPGDFIPQIEQTGFIRPFTMWVIESAMKQWTEWNMSEGGCSIAVNLSVRNLQDQELPAQLALLFEKWEMDPEALIFEITEGAVMSDPQNAMRILNELNGMGIQLAIDDFGTGYSSLNYLKKLPVQKLKIDRSFIMEMADNMDDTVIVRSTIDLAHNLGLKVIAEGVEGEGTLALLRDLGCDIAQGYYLGKPLPANQASAVLSGNDPGKLDAGSI